MNDLVTKIDIHNSIILSGAKRHMLTPKSPRKTILPVSIADLATIPVIARSEATKQSPDIKQLQSMRLLRYTRNDSTGDFYEANKNE